MAVVSFVCSVGNVPLAAVLWNSGISFGGVIAFIFADLIVVPILDIYRRYYSGRVAWVLTWTMFAAIAHVAWNYTSVLNLGVLKTSSPYQ